MDGKQIEVVPLAQALALAKEAQVDLVEIAPNATPPVCRLVDYKKFRYELNKREREVKKRVKEVELKEVRFGPFIGEHDFQVRMSQTREFLSEGHRVKANIRFTGRQMAHPEFGEQLAQRIIEELVDEAVVERSPRMEGRQYITTFLPARRSKHAENENAQEHHQTD